MKTGYRPIIFTVKIHSLIPFLTFLCHDKRFGDQSSNTETSWHQVRAYGPVYNKRQCQCCNDSVMMLVIVFLLKSMESLQNGVATHFQVTPLFSMRTESLATLQNCRSVDGDVWCKQALKLVCISVVLQTPFDISFIFDENKTSSEILSTDVGKTRVSCGISHCDSL